MDCVERVLRLGDLETWILNELEGERIRAGAGKLENGLFLQFSIHFIFVNLWLYKNKTLEVTEVWLGDWEIGRLERERIRAPAGFLLNTHAQIS